MCDPILVTLLKMRPHYSQSSCENATPSSGTSPLASYKDVPIPRSTPRAKCLSLSSAFSSAWGLSAQCLRRRGLTKVNTLKVQFWNYSKQQNKIQTFGPSDDLWQSPPMPQNTPPPPLPRFFPKGFALSPGFSHYSCIFILSLCLSILVFSSLVWFDQSVKSGEVLLPKVRQDFNKLWILSVVKVKW